MLRVIHSALGGSARRRRQNSTYTLRRPTNGASSVGHLATRTHIAYPTLHNTACVRCLIVLVQDSVLYSTTYEDVQEQHMPRALTSWVSARIWARWRERLRSWVDCGATEGPGRPMREGSERRARVRVGDGWSAREALKRDAMCVTRPRARRACQLAAR